MNDTCPKCGTAKVVGFPDAMAWECGTYPRETEPFLSQSHTCQKRQLAIKASLAKEALDMFKHDGHCWRLTRVGSVRNLLIKMTEVER